MSVKRTLSAKETDFARTIAASAIESGLSSVEGARMMGFIIRILATRTAAHDGTSEEVAAKKLLGALEEGLNMISSDQINAFSQPASAPHSH